MAIEIIPDEERYQKNNYIGVFFLFSIILIVLIFGSYFYLYYTINQKNQRIEEINRLLIKTPQEESLEKEVLLKEKKINIFTALVNGHRKTSNIFSFLDRSAHPKILLKDFDFNFDKNIIILKGEAPSFVVLGQQFLAWKKENTLKKIILSDVSLSPEGNVNFTFQLVFDSRIFK